MPMHVGQRHAKFVAGKLRAKWRARIRGELSHGQDT